MDGFDDDTLRLMTADHQITLPGSAILLLAGLLKEDHIALKMVMKMAESAGEDTSEVELSLRTNEVMGAMFMEFISNIFGVEFLQAMAPGNDDDLDMASPVLN